MANVPGADALALPDLWAALNGSNGLFPGPAQLLECGGVLPAAGSCTLGVPCWVDLAVRGGGSGLTFAESVLTLVCNFLKMNISHSFEVTY